MCYFEGNKFIKKLLIINSKTPEEQQNTTNQKKIKLKNMNTKSITKNAIFIKN